MSNMMLVLKAAVLNVKHQNAKVATLHCIATELFPIVRAELMAIFYSFKIKFSI